MGTAIKTTDHAKIRTWVEEHGGSPACVKGTGHDKTDPGILRIDFPGFSGEGTLEHISWDQWFAAFDQNELAMLVDEEPDSRFNKLIRRD